MPCSLDLFVFLCFFFFFFFFGIFDHATLKNYISLLLFTVPYQAIPYWKGQKLNFQKKNILASDSP